MCGLAGIFRSHDRRPPVAEDLSAALALLAHRGPDGEGTWCGGGLALGHRRLAIVDPAGGAQPMVLPDGSAVLALNGEVYDYPEHREALRRAGITPRTHSDTEVLLHLLARDGLPALGRVNGMFALAWFEPGPGRLLLARDPFGVKPLLYARDPATGGLCFASELDALLELLGTSPRLDLPALAERLAFQVPHDHRSLVQGIRALPPGTALLADRDGGERLVRYHELPSELEEGVRVEEWAERLGEAVTTAVRQALRADAPLGVTLSGGLDSSLVLGIAARESGAVRAAYHGYFEEGESFDERPHARRAAEETGVDLVEVPVRAADLTRHLRLLASRLEGPIAGPGALPQLVVAERAAADVKVLLNGQGADEVFGGYARHRLALLEAAEELDPAHLPPELAAYEPLARHLLARGRGRPFAERYYRLVHRGEGTAGLAGPALREAVAGCDAPGIFAVAFGGEGMDPRSRIVSYERRTILPALLHVEDRVSMACSLESRVPLLSPEVVALAARIPPALLFGKDELKALLRRAARGRAPRSAVERRDKMGFPVPLARWAAGPLRATFEEVLRDGPLVKSGLLDPGAPDLLLSRAGGHGRHLWFFLVLSEWMAAGNVRP